MVNNQLFQTLKAYCCRGPMSWRRRTPSARATSWRNLQPPAA